jgi:hypothetical protein
MIDGVKAILSMFAPAIVLAALIVGILHLFGY